LEPDPTYPLSVIFGRNCDQRLFLGLVARIALLDAAQVGLVDLDHAVEPVSPRPHHRATQLLQPRQSGDVAPDSEDPLKPKSAGPVLPVVFYADLRVHSEFSRATSADADLEHMALWARRKGVGVLATGDFTHPAWMGEMEEKLLPAEPGLFRLRPDIESDVAARLGGGAVGAASNYPVRFLLEVEISTIYKKDGATRKVHHLIYVPDLETARRLSASLARIGNIASDGRPILGLDSRDLLEITLSAGEGAYPVPARVWTPWFAVLGASSGFDSVEYSYGDLAPEIFALETGLSSDPPMNWRLSRLDRYTLVSNSDAHSPPEIGREAWVFDCALDYFAIREALRTGAGYGGTVEFFPEEGKYHLDGHRKCGVCLSPEEARTHDGACPVCGKPLTLGVMHRVDSLADRAAADAEAAPPPRAAAFRNLVPLEEVLAEVQQVDAKSKAVQARYNRLDSRLGPELFVLERAPLDEVERAGSPTVAEALARMRAGRVLRRAGYDGEYGVIRLFTDEELSRGTHVPLLFDVLPVAVEEKPYVAPAAPLTAAEAPAAEAPAAEAPAAEAPAAEAPAAVAIARPVDSPAAALDPEQRAAVEITDGPLLILAGPGTG
jgi:DNA helicase-2/ATP-dependent DNA helicase PcrA